VDGGGNHEKREKGKGQKANAVNKVPFPFPEPLSGDLLPLR
jgi:hypothetical protein